MVVDYVLSNVSNIWVSTLEQVNILNTVLRRLRRHFTELLTPFVPAQKVPILNLYQCSFISPYCLPLCYMQLKPNQCHVRQLHEEAIDKVFKVNDDDSIDTTVSTVSIYIHRVS